jgi:O-antigen ligase
MLPAVLLFLGCMLVRPNRATLERVQLAFVALVLFFATYAQVFGHSWAGRLRPLGGSFDTNDMAALMALAFPLSIGVLVRSNRGWPRVLAVTAMVALVLGVVATGSRGSTLALVAGALVFALPLRGGRGVVVWVGLIAGGLLAWNRASPDFRSRMLSLTELENDYNYTADTGRKAVWARGRGYWRANPIAGVGAGNFIVAEGGFNATSGRTGKWSAAHNAYIQALAELGTVGGGLFIAMLLAAARSALPLWWSGRPNGRAPPRLNRPELLASLATCASAAYFLSHAYFTPLYGVLGIIALADRVAKAEQNSRMPGIEAPDAPVLMRRRGERGGLALAQVVPSTAARGGLR